MKLFLAGLYLLVVMLYTAMTKLAVVLPVRVLALLFLSALLIQCYPAETRDFHRRYLPMIVAIAAFALSEPDAGSDVAALSTTATRITGGWRLDGTKTWISNGGIADRYVVFARTGEAPGARGISAFLQSTRADLERDPGSGATDMQLKQNRMMFARIKYQALAIVVVVVIMIIVVVIVVLVGDTFNGASLNNNEFVRHEVEVPGDVGVLGEGVGDEHHRHRLKQRAAVHVHRRRQRQHQPADPARHTQVLFAALNGQRQRRRR